MSSSSSASTERPPYPKKRIAVLFGYSGTGYSGLQLNPGAHTIESVLLAALTRAGLIWDRNAADPKKFDWQRACRTDKGVHAAGNVVSLKGLLVSDGQDGAGNDSAWSSDYAVKVINKELPEGIRVFDVIRVTNSFDSHTQCDSRFYEYIFPTALLAEARLGDLVQADTDENSEDADDDKSCEVTREALEFYKSFRLSLDSLQKLRDVLKCYEGTRSFHNFTIGKPATDPSAQRFIRSFTAAEPFLAGDGIEWIRLSVHGASFMLHQIRKMVGLAVLAVRYRLKDSLIGYAQSPQVSKINVPKAPGVGLFLDRAVFDGYNRYIKTTTAQGVPETTIDFSKYEAPREQLKHDLIYPAVFGPGIGAFHHWLECIERHSYEFAYLCDFRSEC